MTNGIGYYLKYNKRESIQEHFFFSYSFLSIISDIFKFKLTNVYFEPC
jgi:hypothetical protein